MAQGRIPVKSTKDPESHIYIYIAENIFQKFWKTRVQEKTPIAQDGF